VWKAFVEVPHGLPRSTSVSDVIKELLAPERSQYTCREVMMQTDTELVRCGGQVKEVKQMASLPTVLIVEMLDVTIQHDMFQPQPEKNPYLWYVPICAVEHDTNHFRAYSLDPTNMPYWRKYSYHVLERTVSFPTYGLKFVLYLRTYDKRVNSHRTFYEKSEAQKAGSRGSE
jgi:hypothetical protein